MLSEDTPSVSISPQKTYLVSVGLSNEVPPCFTLDSFTNSWFVSHFIKDFQNWYRASSFTKTLLLWEFKYISIKWQKKKNILELSAPLLQKFPPGFHVFHLGISWYSNDKSMLTKVESCPLKISCSMMIE